MQNFSQIWSLHSSRGRHFVYYRSGCAHDSLPRNATIVLADVLVPLCLSRVGVLYQQFRSSEALSGWTLHCLCHDLLPEQRKYRTVLQIKFYYFEFSVVWTRRCRTVPRRWRTPRRARYNVRGRINRAARKLHILSTESTPQHGLFQNVFGTLTSLYVFDIILFCSILFCRICELLFFMFAFGQCADSGEAAGE